MHCFSRIVNGIFLVTISLFVVILSFPALALSNNRTDYYNTLFNGTNRASSNEIPSIIDKDTEYKNQTLNLKHDITIKNSALLTFKEGYSLILSKGINIYNNESNSKNIIFDNAVLAAEGVNIYSGITFKDSVLSLKNSHIDSLTVEGTADIAVKGTTFKTINFSKNLGATDATKTGVGFEDIKVDTIHIEAPEDNKVTREVNIKKAEITNLNIKGDIADINEDDKKLKTNFSIDAAKIKKVEFLEGSIPTDPIPRNTAGLVNFKDTKIDEANINYDLLRGVTFNGGRIENFNLKYTNPAPEKLNLSANSVPTHGKKDNEKPEEPKPPAAPEYSNLQLMGTGRLFVKNFDLGGAPSLNIEGETKGSYNAPLSSLAILNMKGYDENTKFSLYNLKNIAFGVNLKDDCDGSIEECKESEKPKEENIKPGGNNPIININYLQKVTSLGIYNNTVKFTWDIDKVTKNLTVYNLNELTLDNSLIDVSKTNPNSEANPDKNQKFDLDIRYSSNLQSFGTIFNFTNAGAVVIDKSGKRDKDKYVPLRIRVEGNSFVTAKDMLSDLSMDLNGERNLFTLKSNKNKTDYKFHTNYKYQYLNPVDGNQKPNAPSLQYNYWNYAESQRVEQNWYTFETDMVIVDKKDINGKPVEEYEKYKSDHGGNNDFATVWFTYRQPYFKDKDGKITGDQCAVDQGTDGTIRDKDGNIIGERGGFPCEFGNKIQINAGTTTFLKPLDNLTVLEVVGDGEINFHDMASKHVSTKDSQWITKLRMRGGILRMAKVPMYVDKLEVYNHGYNNEATFRPVFSPQKRDKVTDIFDKQKLVVNKEADFHHNYLKVDLYFDKYFAGLDQKITMNVLELGQYTEKEKDKNGKDTKKEVIKDAVIKDLAGVHFNQGIVFDTNYYWKDKNLYVEITRTKDFGYFIHNSDKTISSVFDKVVEKYSTKVDKEGHFQQVEAPDLNHDTLKIINSLFKAKSAEDLSGDFMSLRPVNNEFVLNITALNSERFLDAIKNSNNYSYESNKGKLALWANASIANNTISNTSNILGSSVDTQTYVAGASTKVNNFKIGAFVGYANSNFNSSYYSGDAPLYGGGLYSELGFGNGYFAKLNGVITTTEFKGSRKQYFMDDKSDFKFKGNNTEVVFNFGKTYTIKAGYLTPYISASAGYVMVDSYKENGGSASLNVDSFTSPYYVAGIGAEYAKLINVTNGYLIPKVGVAYNFRYYNLKDTTASFNKINGIDSALNHINYSSNNYDNNSLALNAGLNYLVGAHSSFSTNFVAELINKDLTGYTFFIGYKYSF